jgi:hypothetical protein
MKAFRLPLILLGVLGVLTGLAYWDDWQTKKNETAEKSKDKILTGTKDEVSAILFSDQDTGLQLDLAKDEGTWRIVAPLNAKADQLAVDSLLSSLFEFQYTDEIESPNLADFGLEPAKRVIKLTQNNAQSTISLGNKAPVGYSVYLRLNEDSKVLVGSQHLFSATEKSLRDFRDKGILQVAVEDINEFEVGSKLKLKRDKTLFVTDRGFKTDKSMVQSILNAVVQLKATDFIEGDKSAWFNAKDTIGVKINGQHSLWVVKREDKVYASTDAKTSVYEVEGSIMAHLEKTNEDLRDKKIVAIDTSDEIIGAIIDDERYDKVDGKFVHADSKADASHIGDFIVDLEFGKIVAFLNEKDLPKGKIPSHKLDLIIKRGGGDETTQTIEVWTEKEALIRTGQVVAKVDKNIFDSLSSKEESVE